MSVSGIIVEFNPLHNGHREHIEETKKHAKNGIIAVMSGNFVQRGEPAICDKWQRTKMALLNGVDIVIEIPVPYVVSGADYFARAAVDILAKTGVVDILSFGSECGDLQAICHAGKILASEPIEYKQSLLKGISNGLSFAAAKGVALGSFMEYDGIILPDGLLNKPNNILAMEYCKYLHALGNKIKPQTTFRRPGGATATGIRKKIKEKEDFSGLLPSNCKNILKEAISKNEIAFLNDFSSIFKYLLYSKNLNYGEGLENRFRNLADNHNKISDLLDEVKTKRYVYTRLQRLVIKTILDTWGMEEEDVPYIRILGFKKESSNLLGEITRKATLPVITNGADMDRILAKGGTAGRMLSKEFEAGDIYRLASKTSGSYRSERGSALIIL